LTGKQLKLSDSGLSRIIACYTSEAGVRTLERQVATLCRKTAAALVEGKETAVSITAANLESYLGPEKYKPDHKVTHDEVGVVNGLAWTAVGGATMPIEVAVLEGTGKIELTGNLGDVMKESAKTAISYVRSRAKDWISTATFTRTRIFISTFRRVLYRRTALLQASLWLLLLFRR
jgi:ATP-dependent Lon protease